jgi:hypothetical protein
MGSREVDVLAKENPIPGGSLHGAVLPAGRELIGLLPSKIEQASIEVKRAGRVRLTPVVALVAAFLVGATFLTPPGQAMTDWVGDRLGLGHPGEEPTRAVQRFRSGTTSMTSAGGQPAHVLAA